MRHTLKNVGLARYRRVARACGAGSASPLALDSAALRKMPLDDESRRILRDACEGLPGTFQDGGFMVQGIRQTKL